MHADADAAIIKEKRHLITGFGCLQYPHGRKISATKSAYSNGKISSKPKNRQDSKTRSWNGMIPKLKKHSTEPKVDFMPRSITCRIPIMMNQSPALIYTSIILIGSSGGPRNL
ncbi:hypothetical protein OROGR_002708 [Orobanche gracilis]